MPISAERNDPEVILFVWRKLQATMRRKFPDLEAIWDDLVVKKICKLDRKYDLAFAYDRERRQTVSFFRPGLEEPHFMLTRIINNLAADVIRKKCGRKRTEKPKEVPLTDSLIDDKAARTLERIEEMDEIETFPISVRLYYECRSFGMKDCEITEQFRTGPRQAFYRFIQQID